MTSVPYQLFFFACRRQFSSLTNSLNSLSVAGESNNEQAPADTRADFQFDFMFLCDSNIMGDSYEHQNRMCLEMTKSHTHSLSHSACLRNSVYLFV